MKTIKIDNEVYAYLQKKAIAFEEDPNDVLRRIFSLNQVNTLQKSSSEHIKNPRKPHKQPVTNLKELISAKILAEGQKLILRHSGKKFPDYTATISGKRLIWQGQRYSMSDLAGKAIETIGLDGKSIRGPLFWFTENGISVKELWEQYLRMQGKTL
jgi:predicted CopG family antitoxin